jgi:hypothetical protein
MQISIYGLKPGVQLKKLIALLVSVDSKQTAQTVLNHLKTPPYKLPPIQNAVEVQKIITLLNELGAVAKLEQDPASETNPKEQAEAIPPNKRSIREGLHSKASATLQPRTAPKTTTPSHAHTKAHTKASLSTPKEAHYSYRLDTPVKLHTPKNISKKPLLFLIPVAIIVLLLSFFSTSNSPQKSAPSAHKASAPKAPTSTKNPAQPAQATTTPQAQEPKASQSNAPAPSALEHALNQSENKASQLYYEALEKSNPREATRTLQKSLSHNPYDDKAWDALEQLLQKQGKTEELQQVQTNRYEKNTKVKLALNSIAQQFGEPDPDCRLHPSKVEIFFKNAQSANQEQFYENGQAMWQQIRKKHPEKKFSLKHKQNGLELMVPAEGKFPVYEEWVQE